MSKIKIRDRVTCSNKAHATFEVVNIMPCNDKDQSWAILKNIRTGKKTGELVQNLEAIADEWR